MNYDKPFKTYKEQVEYLENYHQLFIEDKIMAEKMLRVFPYYDIVNGYKDIFMDYEVFKPSISFNYLIIFHNFNIRFQNIIFKYSLYVENIYKANLAYILSSEFGVDIQEYLDWKNFINPKNKDKRKNMYSTLYKINSEAQKAKDFPTKYYKNHHNHIPAWILFKNVQFGTTIDLLKYLKSSDKDKLYRLMTPYIKPNGNKESFQIIEALTIVRKYRNAIAHSLKFITHNPNAKLNVSNLPLEIKIFLLYDYKGKTINNIYGLIISIIYLLNEPILIDGLIREIDSLFQSINPHQIKIKNDFLLTTKIPTDFILRLRNLFKHNIALI